MQQHHHQHVADLEMLLGLTMSITHVTSQTIVLDSLRLSLLEVMEQLVTETILDVTEIIILLEHFQMDWL